MSKKFLVVDANGAYAENTGYGTEEFIDESTGVADAGKPVVLGANGKLDSSIVDSSVVDHDTTSGAAASTIHTSFPLLDGTRDYTGVQSYNSTLAITADTNIVHKKYVDDIVAGERWETGVLSRISTPTGTPNVGDRYIITATATGAWIGREDDIAEWDGTSWDFYTPSTGWKVSVADELDGLYLYSGVAWDKKLFESTTASNGLTKIAQDIQVDPTLAGEGLGFAAGVMNVNVDDSSIEITTDTLNVKASGITNDMLNGSISDDKLLSDFIKVTEVDNTSIEFAGGTLNVVANGINDTHIDFGLGANQVNATDMPIADAGGYTDAVNVEDSLQDIYGKLQLNGVEYIAGAGGVSLGDLVYISSDDTASVYNTITTFHKAIGLASATASAGADFVAMANDTELKGAVLGSGFATGDVLYWDGSALVNSMPSGGGTYVIQCGVVKNGTTGDIAVEVRSVKKNI